MPVKKINNPYAAHYSKSYKTAGGGWCVSKRWVFDDKVRFDWICNTSSEGAAKLIAKALNAFEKEKQDAPVNHPSSPDKPVVPSIRSKPKQGSFGFL